MPKIIENLEQRLKEAAKQQIREVGYGTMTIRSVATACGIGVGTVYNYYPSKDALLAAWLLEEWKGCISLVEAESAAAAQPEAVARCIHDHLMDYVWRHRYVFQDEAARASCGGSYRQYHPLMRSQLAQPLRRFCDTDFQAEFISESLLTWSLSGADFDTIWAQLRKLF